MATAGKAKIKDEVVEWTDSEEEDGQIVCAKCGGWRPRIGPCSRCNKKQKRPLKIGGNAERKKKARIQLDELLKRLDRAGQGATVEEIRRASELAREGAPD